MILKDLSNFSVEGESEWLVGRGDDDFLIDSKLDEIESNLEKSKSS